MCCADEAELAAFMRMEGGQPAVLEENGDVRGKQRRVEPCWTEPSSRGEWVIWVFGCVAGK